MAPSDPAAIRPRSSRSPGTNLRQYATCKGTPAAAAEDAEARADAAVSPHGFSHSIGTPRSATSPMMVPCWVVGATMSTPSSCPRSSIAATLEYTRPPREATTSPPPARTRGRPAGASAPSAPRRSAQAGTPPPSQPPRGEKRPVVLLLRGGLREPLRAARQDVLLDHQPAAERHRAQPVKHRVRVEVAAAERAERLPGPDLGHRRLICDDLAHDSKPGVFEVHVVDPVAEIPQHRHRVAAAEQHVPGL